MRTAYSSLARNVAVYGAGDVAVSAVSFLLLPLYIRHLSPEDYGALALLIAVESVSKIMFRWGLDGAFMRFYLDRRESGALEQLASTICLFLAIASGVLVGVALLASSVIARELFGDVRYLPALRMVLVNTFLLTFTFLPLHVMRMRGEAVTFSMFAFGRSASTLILRLALVVGGGLGVTGLVMADLIVTAAVLPLLWPWSKPLLSRVFSWEELSACLRFGLPRLPHGLAQQGLDAGNKYLLSQHVSLGGLGVYQVGSTIGQSLKFFLSAFETGWAPFYYETARQPDAKVVLAKVTTYGIAIVALLVAGITALAPDLVELMTTEVYEDAAVVVPLIALAIACQGVYLLTSIGLNLTGHTQYYPVSTFAAAAVGLGSGAFLMPRFGAAGAGVAFLLSYVTLAVVAGSFSQRYYPVRYETGRIVRIVIAALVAVGIAMSLPELAPAAAVLVRGLTVVGTFAGLLWVAGFLRPTERAFLRRTWAASGRGKVMRAPAGVHPGVDPAGADDNQPVRPERGP